MSDRKAGTKEKGAKGEKREHSRRSSKEPDVYEGERSKDGKREGRGTCKMASGECYEGEWKKDKMDGRGCMKMADGDVYDGLWKSGLKDGPGTYWYASGRADIVSFCAGAEGDEGVRFSVDRQMAWSLNKGEVVEEITLEEANQIAERIGEPVPPQVSATSPFLRVTGAGPGPVSPMSMPAASPIDELRELSIS